MSQSTKQIKVVSQATPTTGQDFELTAMFDADGEPIDLAAVLADLTDRVEALEA